MLKKRMKGLLIALSLLGLSQGCFSDTYPVCFTWNSDQVKVFHRYAYALDTLKTSSFYVSILNKINGQIHFNVSQMAFQSNLVQSKLTGWGCDSITSNFSFTLDPLNNAVTTSGTAYGSSRS